MLSNPIVLDIAQFFSDYNEVDLTIGDNLFAGELKFGTNGVFAVAAPSPEPDKETGILYQTVDWWSRNTDTQKGYDHLTAIYNFYDRRHHFNTDHYYVHLAHNLSVIEDMDKDIDGAKLLKLSTRFILNSTNAIS